MKFLVDRCAGRRLAEWLRGQGHDVLESRALGPDLGDKKLLEIAAEQKRVLITIDTDFGQLVYVERASHFGIIRLPDVLAEGRIRLMGIILREYTKHLERRAIITIKGQRIRISQESD